ncbi:TPA: hypothetical protein ACGO1T_001772 [Streptococcus suis]
MAKKDFIRKQKPSLPKVSIEEAKRMATKFAFEHANNQLYLYMAAVNLTLMDDFGFDESNLKKLNKRVAMLVSYIREGIVTADDMFKVIKEEKLFDFDEFMNRSLEEIDGAEA